jgi:hypothetical protein
MAESGLVIVRFLDDSPKEAPERFHTHEIVLAWHPEA